MGFDHSCRKKKKTDHVISSICQILWVDDWFELVIIVFPILSLDSFTEPHHNQTNREENDHFSTHYGRKHGGLAVFFKSFSASLYIVCRVVFIGRYVKGTEYKFNQSKEYS